MANLNFDMVGSPNYARLVYDGDGSDTGVGRPGRLRHDRDAVQRLLRGPGPGQRGDGVRRALRLRAVHRRRHPRRRAVLGRRGEEDARAGREVRRDRRGGVRRLLPPGVRHARQPQPPGAKRVLRRGGRRHAEARRAQAAAHGAAGAEVIGAQREAGAGVPRPACSPLGRRAARGLTPQRGQTLW